MADLEQETMRLQLKLVEEHYVELGRRLSKLNASLDKPFRNQQEFILLINEAKWSAKSALVRLQAMMKTMFPGEPDV